MEYQYSTPIDRNSFRRIQYRLKWARKFLKLVENLENYLTYTAFDLGFINENGIATYKEDRDREASNLALPAVNQNHSRLIHRDPTDSIGGLKYFTHSYASMVVCYEWNVLEHFQRPCPSSSIDQYRNRLNAERVFELCYDTLTRSYDELNKMGINANGARFDEILGINIQIPNDLSNRPEWETEDVKQEMVLSSSGIQSDCLFDSNISSTILKVWRLYFVLMSHINHPTPELESLRAIKYFLSSDDESLEENSDDESLDENSDYELENSDYELLKEDWRKFGINL